MSNNLTLRRILMLVLACVLLSSVMTLGIFSMVSPRIFAEAKLNELLPRVEFLSEQASAFFASGRSAEYMRYFGSDPRQWGATVYLIDSDRNVILNTNQDVPHSEYSLNVYGFEELLRQVLSGESITSLSHLLTRTETSDAMRVLFIGMPAYVDGEVAGAVVMLKPLEEIVSAMSTLTAALWFSAFAVLLSMMPLIYWMSRRITLPLRHMRDVALRMASGDFTARANAGEAGEMGDLAKALNHLSSELGSTIAALTLERNQAVTIVNALGEGVLSVNLDGLPMMTNPALQTMLISAGHGRPVPLPQAVWDEFRVALRENRCVDTTFILGEDMLLHLTITPIGDPNTGVVSAIGVFHDETQANRLEQTRREYVANVSHELRTPLTALRALIEPLRDGLIRKEEQRQETYGIILRETMRLSRLVDDMLELSRLQSGRLALEKIRFKVEPLLRETASTYAAKAQDTGHLLQLSLPEEPLPTVLGNPDRVEQVLVALMNNAFTYTPSGSSIILRAVQMEEAVHIIVEDNGPGIKPEDLPNVFERFYKADKSHGGTTGTGLGLAISREVMERLGEDIFVENRPEGGARFGFTVHYM